MPVFEPARFPGQESIQNLLEAANVAVPQATNAVLKAPPPTIDENRKEEQMVSFPAPTLGIKDALVNREPSALEMRNFWPTERGLEIRRGSRILHVFADMEDVDPLAVIPHEFTNEVLVLYPGVTFAYNLATGTSRELAHSMTRGVISHVGMRTELGIITVVVNGVDPMLVYNGTNTSQILNLRVDQDLFPHPIFVSTRAIFSLWLYGKRIFAADRGSNSAWYFAVNAVPVDNAMIPQITELPLGNIFPEGGVLNGGFSWSVDVGDTLNNRCVFTSNQGEFAIYSGDPDIDFVLDGLYVGGSLLSLNAQFHVGGDVYMLLDTGFKLLSEVVKGAPGGGEVGTLEEGSYIELRRLLRLEGAAPTQHAVAYLRSLDMAILADRRPDSTTVVAYNTKLKAWATFTGWDVRAVTVFSNFRLLYVDLQGRLLEAWKGCSDGWVPGVGGEPYTVFCRYTFSPLRDLALRKTATHVQGIWDNLSRVCPSYQMVGYRAKEELPDPDPCAPVAQVFWPDGNGGGNGNGASNPLLAIADIEVREGAGDAVFTVTLPDPDTNVEMLLRAPLDISFNYTTLDGTALAGADYTATAGVTQILMGESSVTIRVPISDDGVEEDSENFALVLSQPVNARISPNNDRGVCTISDPFDPDNAESFSFASFDMPPVSVMGNISYKAGASLAVPGYDSGRFRFITLDGVVRNVPTFVGWNYEHEDGVVPHWLCYVATDADIAALRSAGENVPDSSIPPANSVRGWRELVVQDSVWIGNSRGDISGFDIPAVGVSDGVSAGDLWNLQAPSPYMGHSSGISVITAVYGQWLSRQGEFWVISPTHETRYMLPGDNVVYTGRTYVIYRPMSEVDRVRRQIDQSVDNDNQTGLRALGFYYYDNDDPGDDSDVASSSLVGRWFSFVRRVSRALFGVAQEWDWERQSQLSSPPANVTPAQIPVDYE